MRNGAEFWTGRRFRSGLSKVSRVVQGYLPSKSIMGVDGKALFLYVVPNHLQASSGATGSQQPQFRIRSSEVHPAAEEIRDTVVVRGSRS
jgi:hypothetical protein